MMTAIPNSDSMPAPVLRWSGSKARLVSVLEKSAPPVYGKYIEAFAGSACLFFKIRPTKAVLGDINPAVIDVYKAIRDNPLKVHEYLASIPSTREAYYTLREIDRSVLSIEQRAAQTIFLMKACFNGVFRTNKAGKFNVPMGSRVYALPSLANLLAVSKSLSNTQLVAGDFGAATAYAKSGDFVYLDPPYPSTGRYRGEYGFKARFLSDDADRLIETIRALEERGAYVMLSYVHDETIIEKLPGWSCRHESVRRSVAGGAQFRVNTNEMVLTNYCATT